MGPDWTPIDIIQTKQERRESDALQGCHWTTSLLKRWLLGTHAGAVRPKHLQGYLNEFAFRFNRRHNLFAAFQTVLGIAGRVHGPTRKTLYATGEERFRHVNELTPRYRGGRR